MKELMYLLRDLERADFAEAIVGERCSFSLRFGKKIIQANRRNPRYEWILGSYNAAWRVMRDDKLICGSLNPVETDSELQDLVDTLEFSKFIAIQQLSKFDLRILLDNGISVDFLCASSDQDESFHIFGPHGFFASYSVHDGFHIA